MAKAKTKRMAKKKPKEATFGDVAEASAQADMDAKHRPPTTLIEELECTLSDAEISARAGLVATKHIGIAVLKLKKKQAADQFAAQIKMAEQDVNDLCDAINRKTERRQVECVETFDFRLGEVRIVRSDTKEIVERRAMTASERQVPLPEVEKKSDPEDPQQATDIADPQLVLDAEEDPIPFGDETP